jgi:hypothetical protein
VTATPTETNTDSPTQSPGPSPTDTATRTSTKTPTPTFIAETQQRTSGQCAALYPAPPAPRSVAGAPVAGNVIKCTLKNVDTSDYAVAFTPAQVTRLNTVFPDGVCNYAVPGVEQQDPAGTWQSF